MADGILTRRHQVFQATSWFLAAVLFTTALLKLHLLFTDPFADITAATPVPLLWMAFFAEIGIVWLVFSKITLPWQWLIFISFFGVLSLFSFANVLMGKATCGCTGAFVVNPVWFLAFDIFAVAILAVNNPGIRLGHFSNFQNMSESIAKFSGVVVVVIGFSLTQSSTFKDYVRKTFVEDVKVSVVNLGNLPMSKTADAQVRITNNSSEIRNIWGMRKSCTCVVDDLQIPLPIPANGYVTISLSIHPKGPGPFHQRVLFYVDSKRQHVAAADIVGSFGVD